MANQQTLDSYTLIREIDELIIKPGDCVLMRPPKPSIPLYIARVDKIVSDGGGINVKVHARWYYRPEEVTGDRKSFLGVKEVFLSDHIDVESVDTIEGKCKVHDLEDYRKLNPVGIDDFYSRLRYNHKTEEFKPDEIAVYCKCEMPYNPDFFMIQCAECDEWFHPACIDMTEEMAKQMNPFLCQDCSPQDPMEDMKRRRM